MRVELNSGQAISQTSVERNASSGAQKTSQKENDEPHFSPGQASVSSLAAGAFDSPEVRTAKVEALRSQIAAGNYHVSSSHVAGAIIDQMRNRNQTSS